MKINDWILTPVSPITPYTPPECIRYCLIGEIDGKEKQTSAIRGKSGQSIVTQNSVYELGEPKADYEREFPGARQRILDSLKEIKDCGHNACLCEVNKILTPTRER